MKIVKIFFLVLPIILNVSCSSTLKSTKLSENGYFKTDTKIMSDGVRLVEPFKNEYKKLLYVKTDGKDQKLNAFYMETFKNMNQFEKVVSKEEMESLVLEKNLSSKVPSVSDKVGLHNLQNEIGSFLVVEPYAQWKGGYDFVANLTVYDPETGKNVLLIENKAFNWAGLDEPLFYPLFNAFLKWVKNEKIETAPSVNEKPTE